MHEDVTAENIRKIVREELLSTKPDKIAYTLREAASAVGVSVDVLRRHIQVGNLVAKYPSSRPIIETAELYEWLDHLPSEPKGLS